MCIPCSIREVPIASWPRSIHSIYPTVLKLGRVLHMDLNTADYRPITDVFHSLRPDIVIVNQNIIVTLELTVCHESNLINSKQIKTNKRIFVWSPHR